MSKFLTYEPLPNGRDISLILKTRLPQIDIEKHWDIWIEVQTNSSSERSLVYNQNVLEESREFKISCISQYGDIMGYTQILCSFELVLELKAGIALFE